MSPRHVLVVTTTFPPAAGPDTDRTLALAAALVAQGCAVTVLTPDRLTAALLHPSATSEPRDVAADVAVVRVPAPTSPDDQVVSRWPTERVTHPDRYDTKARTAMSAAWAGDDLALWRPRLEATAVRLHRQVPVALTIACVPSYTVLCVAQRLAEVDEVPYALDVRGPWRPTSPPDASAASEWLAWMTARAVHSWDRASEPAAGIGTVLDSLGAGPVTS
jgi:hypothetical protein